MTLDAEELRDLVKSEIERRDWSTAQCAALAPHPDGSRGLHRNAAYAALKVDDPSKRVGTLLRLAEALGFATKRTYTLTNLGIRERRRLHDDYEDKA